MCLISQYLYIIFYKMYITYDCDYTKYLIYTSFLFLLSAFLNFFYDSLLSSVIIFILFLTSVNHWKRPDNKIIKILDLIIVKLVGFLYFINSFYKDEFYRILVMNIGISMVMFYVIEHILDFYENNQWIIFHMSVHIYAAYVTILFLIV
jgi:hypothetical protein